MTGTSEEDPFKDTEPENAPAGAPAATDDANNSDAAEPDAEVSFVTKDLAPILPKAKIAPAIPLDESGHESKPRADVEVVDTTTLPMRATSGWTA